MGFRSGRGDEISCRRRARLWRGTRGSRCAGAIGTPQVPTFCEVGTLPVSGKVVVFPGRRSKVLPAVGRPCRGGGYRIPRGADAPLGLPQGSRRSPCFYSSPLDAARSKDGAGPRRLMLGTLAACLRFRRPRGRGRRSPLLNVGARLAARRRWPPSRRLTPPGSFRPSSRLRFRGRARRGRGCGLTGSTHQPPLCRLWRQQPAKKERKPCGLDDRTACLVRRLAPAERRSFSRLAR